MAYAVFGFGFALVSPPIANTAVSGMPAAQAGVAAAVATTSRQVGLTLGVAVLGVVAGGDLGGPIGPSFAHATRAAWWIVAGIGLTVTALAYVTTTHWAQKTARRTATRLEHPDRHDLKEPTCDGGERPRLRCRLTSPVAAAARLSRTGRCRQW
jgi:hypothetical protein